MENRVTVLKRDHGARRDHEEWRNEAQLELIDCDGLLRVALAGLLLRNQEDDSPDSRLARSRDHPPNRSTLCIQVTDTGDAEEGRKSTREGRSHPAFSLADPRSWAIQR